MQFQVITGKEITSTDIKQAYHLDTMVYSIDLQIEPSECVKWYNVNPDIYIMIRDIQKNVIIGYTNVAPITDECYNLFRSGAFKDTSLTSDMILSYDMPFPYSVYFTSIVIHPDYQNSEVFMRLFSAIVDKFLLLGRHDVYVKRMIADAVSVSGEKFCKLFGMNKIKNSNHSSSLYEVSMIPPRFRIISKKTKELYDYYMQKYKKEPHLFGGVCPRQAMSRIKARMDVIYKVYRLTSDSTPYGTLLIYRERSDGTVIRYHYSINIFCKFKSTTLKKKLSRKIIEEILRNGGFQTWDLFDNWESAIENEDKYEKDKKGALFAYKYRVD